MKEQPMHDTHRIRPLAGTPGWGQPPGWGQAFPGWSPLVDHDPLPLQVVRSLSRWWWPTLGVAGFLAVVAWVLGHEDTSTPGRSTRGLLTIALAAALVFLLTIHRRRGPRPLARALAEYTVVALLATLLAATGAGVDQRPAPHDKPAKAGHTTAQPAARPNAGAPADDDQPAVLQVGAKVVRAITGAVRAVADAARWLADLWRQADQRATSEGEAMTAPPHSPTPSAISTWRRP
jgi:hypothetical protein